MRVEPNSAVRRVRRTTIALATAALFAASVSETVLARRLDQPSLDVPYVPSPPEVVDAILDMASVSPADFVMDLGSGDGRIAIAAAKRGARALGVDIDPMRIQDAEDNARHARVQDRARFRQQDLFETRLSDATVLTMYLLSKVNLALRPRILDECKPGTRVVSHAFDMGDWKPDFHTKIGHRHLFMWIVPAKVAGRWRVEAGGRIFDLTLRQKLQHITGAGFEVGGARVEVENGWMLGARIRLVLSDGTRFDGCVKSRHMGSSPDDGKAPAWKGVQQT